MRAVAVRVAVAAARHVAGRRPEVFAAVGDSVPDGAAAGGAVATKSTPTDPVTVVDTETEDLIRDLLGQSRPDDTILGEEGGGDAGAAAGVRWIVDPIDGTVNFLYGVPAFAVSVAAQVDGVSVAGAVVDVAAAAVYSAARGHGAMLHEAGGEAHRLRCNTVSEVSMSLLATGFGYSRDRRSRQGELIAGVLPRVRDIRRIGSAALDLCMVASGRVDAHFEHGLSPWDWAAGSLIAAEAGAVLRLPSPDTMSAAGAVVVAAAPGIAKELDAMFTELGVLEPIPD
ncbi:inositol monophosphatase [Rhodococcus spelaei]|uniref:inositol-phosphate phosphatase n=1 Tax=Rhodococcus spelaei TaxID=2546320 RepID=A0A541B2F8_9NOCA|nr:inositol monophosphatase family protein [Rhodococcus spelaei]TQF66500.1 inositol monophosphatase [Rhodococcus spelaei]